MAKPGGGLQATLVAYSSSSSSSSSSSPPARSRSPQTANDNSSPPRAQIAGAPIPPPAKTSESKEGRSQLPLAKKTSPLKAQTGRAPIRHADKVSTSKNVHSPSVPAKKTSPPRRVFVSPLSRNVKEAHLRQIFEDFGDVVNVEIPVNRTVNLPRSYGYVEFKKRDDAEKALLYMDEGQIDGNVVKLKFVQHQMASSPTVALPHVAPKGDAHTDTGATGGENDSQKRRREPSPPRNTPSHSRKRSPLVPKVEPPSCPSSKQCASSPTRSLMRSSSSGVGLGSQSPLRNPPGPPNQQVQRPPTRHGRSHSSHSTNQSSEKGSRKDV